MLPKPTRDGSMGRLVPFKTIVTHASLAEELSVFPDNIQVTQPT